jgi:hypothetical protein
MKEEVKTTNPLPSKDKIRELVGFIENIHGPYSVLINPVAPLVRSSGLRIDDDTQRELQIKVNQKGLYLAIPGEDSKYKEGDRVIMRNHYEPLHTKTITTSELLDGLAPNVVERITDPSTTYNEEIRSAHYKKYVVLVVYTMDIVMSIKNG